MSYTALAVVAVVGSVLLDLVVLRTALVRRRVFWVAYAIVLGFQLLTNGWLTGRDIVTYSGDAVIGGSHAIAFGSGRLFYAPVEDVGFGFALVLQSLAWWVFWGRREVRRAATGEAPAGRSAS
ncbi:MAG: lycopene cyclase domain-containing protein [Actinomycetota bacterium]|nr:lycopene cyclase domain-containing protein [Actinomycetota bacterium]